MVRSSVVSVLLLLIASLHPLTAEELHISVYDRDLDIPLEGVLVLETTTGTGGLTDIAGEITLHVDLPAPRAILSLSLIGYEPVRTMTTNLSEPLRIPLVIQGILEAEELVIEAERIGRTDDEAGVSVVVERDFIKASAMIGIVEDVMTTVKLLPGVSYSGSFNNNLSVRGGEPNGLTHVIDGFVVKYPYHWGGGVSIFNPHIIESVKLSAGIFPVMYGQATSGLMEVSTVNPSQGLRWEFAQSTSTLEGYAQIPFGETAGLFVGTRLTNYDLVFAMTGQFLEEQGVTFSRIPFIYDGYAKFLLRPEERTELSMNMFVGTDGIGMQAIEQDIDLTSEIQNTFDFRWINTSAFASLNAQHLFGDNLLLKANGGYEYIDNIVDGNFTERGTRVYSNDFVDYIDMYYADNSVVSSLVEEGGSFTIDQPNGFYNDNIVHHLQIRFDGDLQTNRGPLIQFGLGGDIIINRYTADFSFWSTIEEPPGNYTSTLLTYDSAAPGNTSVSTFGYTNLHWRPFGDRVGLDTGFRLDHSVQVGDDYSLNTYPVPGPRVLIHYSLPETTISAGVGLFSKMPFEAAQITGDMDIHDFEVSVPKNLMTLVGVEHSLPDGYRFKVEGYYKFLFDRFYINETESSDSDTTSVLEPILRTDGTGHVAGFDLLLDRRTSKNLDGMLSYSFIWARYRNPTSDGTVGSATEPRERWYFPSFHRYHTLNLVINYKPKPTFTLTSTVTFASGTLEPEFGDKIIEPILFVDNNGNPAIAETYNRDEYYDDTNRHGFELPVDLRASFHRYRGESKMYREIYVGAEDILAPLLSRIAPVSTAVRTDKYTGEDTSAAQQGFSFPVVSVGFRYSY